MEFKKLDGEGAPSGWMRYYGNGRRLATRTAANELRIMLINAAVVPEEARSLSELLGHCSAERGREARFPACIFGTLSRCPSGAQVVSPVVSR